MLNSTEIERTVTLLPLPEQLRLPDIAICTKNHWITTDAYFNNLTFEGIEKGESLILTVFSGFALQGIPHSNKFRLAL